MTDSQLRADLAEPRNDILIPDRRLDFSCYAPTCTTLRWRTGYTGLMNVRSLTLNRWSQPFWIHPCMRTRIDPTTDSRTKSPGLAAPSQPAPPTEMWTDPMLAGIWQSAIASGLSRSGPKQGTSSDTKLFPESDRNSLL